MTLHEPPNMTSSYVTNESLHDNTTSLPTDYYLSGRTTNQFYYLHRPVIVTVDRYISPIWYVVGITGNIMAFSIWIRPRMRHSSGIYLAALALADLIFLLLHIIFELEASWSVTVVNKPGLCELYPVIYMTSQHIPPLLVFAFTIERYISICHPFKREMYCTTTRAVTMCIVIGIYTLSLHIIQAYFWTYNYDQKDCTIRPAARKGGAKSLWSVWTWVTELVNFGVVPLTILLLNILVILETRRLALDQARRLHIKRGKKSSATTVMLLAVSFYLIFTTLPVTIVYAMYLMFAEGDIYMNDEQIRADPTWQRHLTYLTVKIIVQELGMTHYALNFYIYLLTGKMFRQECRTVFCRLFCPSRPEYLRHSSYTVDEMKTLNTNTKDNIGGHKYGTPL